MVQPMTIGEIPAKKLRDNKSKTVREAIDAFLELPQPMWDSAWVGSGRVQMCFTVEPISYKRLKEKAKKFGYSFNQAVEIGLMAL